MCPRVLGTGSDSGFAETKKKLQEEDERRMNGDCCLEAFKTLLVFYKHR